MYSLDRCRKGGLQMDEKILVVDDEKEIAGLVEVYLKNEGYTVLTCYNGTDALAYIEQQQPSLAVLDVMLPDMDGFTLCRKIREKYLFPIVMLTARVEDMDKIVFIDDGRVVDVGTHDELVLRCPDYKKMVDLQKLEDEGRQHNA